MKYFLFLVISAISLNSVAGYNSNHKSELSGVFVYSGSDHIYVTLKSKPATSCNNTYFVIDNTVQENRRQMLLSRLLLAFASKETVNIGYDKESGDCVDGYVRIHRVG